MKGIAAATLAYTIKGGIMSGDYPQIYIGQNSGVKTFSPSNPVDDSYWFYFLDANNPQSKVYDVVVPGSNNSSVPANIDQYMNNPSILFGVVTQSLSTLHVPQGALYNFFVTYGSGPALDALEQLNSSMSCGYFGQVSYALIGQGGPRGGTMPPPASYEASEFIGGLNGPMAFIEMSLMPMPNGGGPYSIVDGYTF